MNVGYDLTTAYSLFPLSLFCCKGAPGEIVIFIQIDGSHPTFGQKPLI